MYEPPRNTRRLSACPRRTGSLCRCLPLSCAGGLFLQEREFADPLARQRQHGSELVFPERRAFGRRTVVAFQPHRYTRTHDLFEDFCSAFNDADVVFLTSVYAAGEDPIVGATSDRLVEAIRSHGHPDVTFVEKRADLVSAIKPRLQPGDIVITLGAGDITNTGPELLSALSTEEGR